MAIQNGHLDIVKYLIEQKADIEAKDNSGCTALMLARGDDIVEYLTIALAKHVEDRRQEVLRVLSPYTCTDVAGVVVAYL